jgi:hypothetical protein
VPDRLQRRDDRLALGIEHALVSPRRSWDEASFEGVAAILPEIHAIEPPAA